MESQAAIVKDLMSKNVLTAFAHSNVRNAIKVMVENDVGSVVVKDSAGPRGVFTERDLLSKILARRRDQDGAVLMEVLSPLFPSIDSDATVVEAGKRMAMGARRTTSLMVFQGPELIGILTATDVVRYIQHLNAQIDLSRVVARDVVTESEGTSVAAVVDEMERLGVGSVLVGTSATGQGEPYGIFTERDLVKKVLWPRTSLEKPVREFVSSPLTTAQEGIGGVDAAKIMAASKIKRLPLKRGGDNSGISGIVTAADIIRAYAVSAT